MPRGRPKGSPNNPGVCEVCGCPKRRASSPHCRACWRLMEYLLQLHRPDDVPRRVGVFRWQGKLPPEGRGA
jgi:hypothetical protein